MRSVLPGEEFAGSAMEGVWSFGAEEAGGGEGDRTFGLPRNRMDLGGVEVWRKELSHLMTLLKLLVSTVVEWTWEHAADVSHTLPASKQVQTTAGANNSQAVT